MAENQFPCAVSIANVPTNTRAFVTTSTTSSQQKAASVKATSFSAVCSAVGQKTKITTIFFDLDNTLIPTRSGDSKACRKLTEVLENQFGFTKEESSNATQSFLKSFRRCPDNSQTSLDSWRTYLWREALPTRHKHLAEQIYARWLHLRYRQLALPADYVALLRAVRERDFRLALITNGPSNAQWEKIRKLSVSQYFDCILVSSDLPWEKPHPNIFFAACKFLGVKPAECAMVGDKLETDIKGGCLAGLGATFWTPLNFNEPIDLTDVEHPPNFVLRNVLELCKYFSISGVGATSSSAAASAVATTNATTTTTTQAKARRSSQQFGCIATTSTCTQSDYHHYQQQQQSQTQQQQLLYQHYHQQQQNAGKYRRGGSLPAIESFNSSENENSSDSLFN